MSIEPPAPADTPSDVQQASTVAHWTFAPAPADPAPVPANLPTDGLPATAPQNVDPSYVNNLLKAIQSQGVSGNPALSSLA